METTISPMLILMPILCGAFSFLCAFLYYSGQLRLLKRDIDYKDSIITKTKRELEEESRILVLEKGKLELCNQQIAVLQTEYKNILQKHSDLENNNDHQLQKFENIAHRILKAQSSSLYDYQSIGMKEILNPLKERIRSFEDKIEKSNLDSAQRHQSLKEQIIFLSDKSEKVAKDANNLANALKGNYKQQGNWGEMILESILDKSGLQKDREYFLQMTERNDQGKMLKPDVVIELPDGKKLVIDSKVSLSSFNQIVNCNCEEDAKLHKQAHLMAVKNHIDGLTKKNYHRLYDIDSPDFVMMFIPIDTAFIAALEIDGDLYNYAFDKNIVIVTSSTLLATLKTVETMWRNDKQNKYAAEISVEAGKMYDKFVSFLDEMKKLGLHINTAQNTYNGAMKKLSSGTGNLIKRAENVRELGAKTNKQLVTN